MFIRRLSQDVKKQFLVLVLFRIMFMLLICLTLLGYLDAFSDHIATNFALGGPKLMMFH